MNKFIFTTIFSINFLCFSQEQPTYYELLRNAEKQIVKKDFELAVEIYEEAFNDFGMPYIKDLIAATVIAQKTNKKELFYAWLEECLKRGLRKEKLNYFISNDINDKKLKKYFEEYEKYKNIYIKSIDVKFCKRYLELDKKNQFEIFLSKSDINTNSPELYGIDDKTLADKYFKYVIDYGFSNEFKCGKGAYFATLFTDNEQTGNEYKGLILEEIDIDFREKDKDKLYFVHSYEKNTDEFKYLVRDGNSLLWHIDVKSFSKLDSILKVGIKKLTISPEFYAATLERNGDEYLMAWGSYYWFNKMKMNFDKINRVPTDIIKEVNAKRIKLGIRTVEEDLILHNAIIEIEGLNKRHYKGTNRNKANNLLYKSLFISAMP